MIQRIMPVSANVDRLFMGRDSLPYMIEVELKKDFLVVVETLTRVGIPGPNDTINQVGHILRFDDKYYIAHAKQLHGLCGKTTKGLPTRAELARTVRVAKMLQAWGCLEIINPVQCDIEKGGLVVVPYDKLDQYNLKTNFDFKKDK